VLLVSPRGLRELELRMKGPAARVVRETSETSERKGWKRVHLPIVSIEDATFELLQLGAEAIVESPRELREVIRETARKMGGLSGVSR
jgi:predicted DNA-binding transcriptional regulator YafY